MIINLYCNQVSVLSERGIATTLRTFGAVKREEVLLVLFGTQANAGQTVFDDKAGWTHEVVYAGF